MSKDGESSIPERALPYSYHTFMYPFCYEEKDGIKLPDEIKNRGKWKRDETLEFNNGKFESHVDANYKILYNRYQYFFEKAYVSLYGSSASNNEEENKNAASTCLNYIYDFGAKKEYLHTYPVFDICIQHGNQKTEVTSHRLRINDLHLIIYPQMKIGMFVLETENHGEEKDFKDGLKEPDIENLRKDISIIGDAYVGLSQEQRIERITMINDKGRRVMAPFLTIQDGVFACPSIPVYSGIHYEEGTYAVIPYKKSWKNIKADGLLQCFQTLLFDESAAAENGIMNALKIRPAIDDRMFVACCLGASSLPALKPISSSKTADGFYQYQHIRGYRKKRIMAEQLYKIIFMESDLCCQNAEMLQNKLRDHVYARWIDCGTIHSITEYSAVCITRSETEPAANSKEIIQGRLKKGLSDSVIIPFLTLYADMVRMALIQRTALIRLETKISEISKDLDQGKNQDINIKEIRDVWTQYIQFQDTMFLPEVTFQEQGVEIYDMLKRDLRLEQLNRYVSEEIKKLHQWAELMNSEKEKKSEERLDKQIQWFTFLSIAIALFGVGQDFLFGVIGDPVATFGKFSDWVSGGILMTVLLAFGVGICLLYYVSKKWKRELFKNTDFDESSSGYNAKLVEPQKEKKSKEPDETKVWIVTLVLAFALVVGTMLIRVFCS